MIFKRQTFAQPFLCIHLLQISGFLLHSFALLLLNDFYHLMAICSVYSTHSAKEKGKMHAPKDNSGRLSHCTNTVFLGKCGSNRVSYSASLLSQFLCFPFHLSFSLLYASHILLRKQTNFAVQRLERTHSYEKTSEHV